MENFGEKCIMSKTKKINNKLDVRVVFDAPLSESLRTDIAKEHRTFPEQIRYIVSQYYQEYPRKWT